MTARLHNIQIASPCPADWNQMVGDDRVRHCSQCNLNVYNLSAMSSIEAQELVARHEGRMCVRLYHRPDGTVLTQDCPVGLKIVLQRNALQRNALQTSAAWRVSRAAGIALSAISMLSGYPLLAQTHTNHQDAYHQAVQSDSGLEITVVDNQGKACAGAIVELADLSNQPIAKAIAGNDGVARLTGLSPDRYTLTVRCPGFAPVQTRVILREQATFKLDVSHEAPLIETTQATVTTTGGAVVLEAPPLIDTRASQVMSTFSNTVLTTGGAIITENRPVGPPRKRGFFRRALDKMFHPHK